ncbi:glycoside hydrolase superfamily [Lineolata rhizophorae]|uniref:Glycoside hydrolase superfamily n=1 Tax=Lineolata rhizophorae TaxID=578093 RepID=A0A6A6NNT8_9PEZI|nr:glycoside hydrolase superfamily [Lineolata rhizophorae]
MPLARSIVSAALLGSSVARALPHEPRHTESPDVQVSCPSTPDGAGPELLDAFVSYSVELAFWPDFGGNLSHPNTFSNNLLDNLGELQGTKPHIRVGGNTQDYAIYDPDLPTATKGIVVPSRSPDYPYYLTIGPSFFESYQTFPSVKYAHGFNLAKNGSAARRSLVESAKVACKVLGEDDRFLLWELGNEPDLYKTSAQGIKRPADWDEEDYVREWKDGTAAIRDAIAEACPEMASDARYKYMAPSFAGTSNSLDPNEVWADGLDGRRDIAWISQHNYIDGATQPGVTLQGTLMNHTRTASSVTPLVSLARNLSAAHPALPFVLGETNSLYNQGAPGLSDSFGAALWGLDFRLHSAARGVAAVHMHQGTGYRYAAWQPVATATGRRRTRAPYYGDAAAAAMVGARARGPARVRELAAAERAVAYAAYEGAGLARLMAISLDAYNGTGAAAEAAARPAATFALGLPEGCAREARVARLMAGGSDAVAGVTWDGVSFDWELDEGRPVVVGNATRDERVAVGEDGVMVLEVPHSSAAMVRVDC